MLSIEMEKVRIRQQVVHPRFNVLQRHVEARRDDAALVDAARQLDHDLPASVVVDDLELADVPVLLHRPGLQL